jgi:hypothetical protein
LRHPTSLRSKKIKKIKQIKKIEKSKPKLTDRRMMPTMIGEIEVTLRVTARTEIEEAAMLRTIEKRPKKLVM